MTDESAGRGNISHPPVVRIMHWINALVMIIMIGSGWRIYNDSPLIDGTHFPDFFTLGGDPAGFDRKWQNHASGALLWHFAAMWLLVANGIAYLAYGIVTRRFRENMLPITIGGIHETIAKTLRLELTHDDGYNHVQRLLYLGVIGLAILMVATGLAIWKPVQFQTLASVFGSFQSARWLHFLAMTGIVLFMIVHVALSFLVPRTLIAMTIGEAEPLPPST